MVDPVTLNYIPSSAASKQGGIDVFAKLTGSPATAGLVSAGAACDVLILHLARKRLRARSVPATTMQQQVQPDSIKNASASKRLVFWAADNFSQQVTHRTLIVAFVASVGLGCGAIKCRKCKSDRNSLREAKFFPLKSREQDEPDAEPKSRNWFTSIPGKDLRRTRSDLGSPRASVWEDRPSGRPVVSVKSLRPRHPVASIDDEPEEEDSTGIDRGAAPGSRGFVAQQTADVERVLQFFRMNTEGQLHMLDEEGLEQMNRESQVVPDGLVHLCTEELERQIQRNPLAPRAWSIT